MSERVLTMPERSYQFRERMLEVHKAGRRMPFARPKDGQTEITDDWCVYIPTTDDRVLYNAARDMVDYFAVSMGVYVRLQAGGDIPEKAIVYQKDSELCDGSYRISVSDTRVVLSGGDSRAAAQAGYHAEDLMNLEEGPYLDLQDTEKQPLYDTRMTHSGFGLDNFPDAHLNAIAHAGFTAILLFVRGYNEAANAYLDFNDIIYRAAGYGLDVYMYGYMKSHVYPEGEAGRAYYDSLYGELFRRCPGFKGVILVGESCEFHSRDERTTGMLRRENMLPDGSKKITDKPNPGWWPCRDYPLLINMIKDAIRAQKPDAELVFWTYNWSNRPTEPRLELIRNIPMDVTLEVTFEMREKLERDGVIDSIDDYALYFEGPGQPFVSEAEEAKRCGLRLYSMTNTAGATWDMGVIPYVPAPYQWMRRYRQMRKCHDSYGLCGLMESHHYGFYPSFISELAKWMFHSPDTEADDILRRLAVRDFSADTAEQVVEAWGEFSEGIRHTVTNSKDQYGPYRIGPSFPLLMEKEYTLPSVPYARFGGNSICRTGYPYPLQTDADYKRIAHELDYAERALCHFDRGADIIDSVIPLIHPSKRDDAKRLAGLGRFMARTVQTTIHTKQWLIAKKSGDYKKMLEIGNAEIQNAKATIPLVELDSRLGFEPSMEYMTDREHIEWKIAVTQQVMNEEISPRIK